MQPLWHKLTSHCVTSYPSALVTSKTDSYATSRSLTSCRCVVSKSRTRYVEKLWDDWGTNRTVNVWQTMQPLSDKLTSHCVTSYPSALVTSKTDSYATSRSLTSCRCVVSKSRTRYLTNQRATAWQAMGWLRHKQNTVWQTMQLLSDKLTSRCVASYPSALVTSKTYSYATNRSLTSCRCVVSKPRTRWLRHKPSSHFVTNYAATIWQTNYSVCVTNQLIQIDFDFDLEMCFTPQRHGLFHLSSDQMAPHPSL